MYQGYLKYILGIPERPSIYAEIGKAAHAAIAEIINNNLDINEAVKKALEKAEMPIPVDTVKNHVINMVEKLEELKKEGYQLKAEEHFITNLNPDDPFSPQIQGYIDGSDEEKAFVIDWKTGNYEEAKENTGLAFYCWYKHQQTGKPVTGMLFFSKTKEISIHKFTKRDFNKLLKKAEQDIQKIESAILQLTLGGNPEELFPPTENDYCYFCSYHSDCPLQKDKKEIKNIKKSIEKITSIDQAEEIAELINQLEDEVAFYKKLLKLFVDDTGEGLIAGGKIWDYRESISWKLPKENPELAKAEIAKAIITKGEIPWKFAEFDLKSAADFLGEEELKCFGCTKAVSRTFRPVRAKTKTQKTI